MYQNVYDKAKRIFKKDACMKFYDTSGFLYLETDASGCVLEARLLQVRECMNCGHGKLPDKTFYAQMIFPAKAY